MQLLDITYSQNIRDEIFDIVQKRKNLMFYDGNKSEMMPENVLYRFFIRALAILLNMY